MLSQLLNHKYLNHQYLKKYLFIFLIFGLGLITGLIFLPPKKINTDSDSNRQLGFRLISPLLECNESASNNQASALENELQDLINKRISRGEIKNASLYYRDLNNGPWININGDQKFSPSSLLKVPILIAYLKIAESDPSIFNKKITINQTDNISDISQNIIPLKQVQIGNEYTVNELLEYMIEYSDNIAANSLIQNCPTAILDNVYADLNLANPLSGNSENFMTVKTYSLFFRILYNASYLNREMSEKALTLLTRTNYYSGLVAGVPLNVPLAHKFGERGLPEGKQLHDCGIIYKTSRHYLLCIMTRGDDFNLMKNVIKDLSKIIYEKQ
ncbi:MAG: serine hydrolase [Patescibacteria group bacterium]